MVKQLGIVENSKNFVNKLSSDLYYKKKKNGIITQINAIK